MYIYMYIYIYTYIYINIIRRPGPVLFIYIGRPYTKFSQFNVIHKEIQDFQGERNYSILRFCVSWTFKLQHPQHSIVATAPPPFEMYIRHSKVTPAPPPCGQCFSVRVIRHSKVTPPLWAALQCFQGNVSVLMYIRHSKVLPAPPPLGSTSATLMSTATLMRVAVRQ